MDCGSGNMPRGITYGGFTVTGIPRLDVSISHKNVAQPSTCDTHSRSDIRAQAFQAEAVSSVFATSMSSLPVRAYFTTPMLRQVRDPLRTNREDSVAQSRDPSVGKDTVQCVRRRSPGEDGVRMRNTPCQEYQGRSTHCR
jgi:hypothetical protein